MPDSSVTVTDVEDLLGIDLTATSARVDKLIERGERMVRAELPGFTFGETDDAEATLTGTGDEVLRLPYYPVRAVSEVTLDGNALAADGYTVNALGDLRRRAGARLDPLELGGLNYRWPDRGVIIVVTFDYGLAASATPDDVFDVIVEAAAGRVANPAQVAQEALGDRSVSFGGGGANADRLTADQRRRLRQWRRNAYASVRIGS